MTTHLRHMLRHSRPERLKPWLIGLALVLTAAIPLTSRPAEAAAAPAIWVGSPVNGTWGVSGIGSTTPAGNHHRLVKASPQNDWAVDLSRTGAGPAAILYVAPSNAAYNSRVTTRVGQIIDNSACANGGGGDLVTIRILFDGVTVGQVTYAHLNRNPALAVGQNVTRWGTQLGTVANLTGGATGGANCWTGPHVHTELRATTNYACWNRGFRTGQGLSRSNFIGFVSGPALAGTARACP
jgi:hypothetical protein